MEIYRKNILKYEQETGWLSGRLNRLSWLRVMVFIAGVILLVLLANARIFGYMILTGILFLILYILLVIRHNRIRFLKSHAVHLKDINDAEIRRLENSLSDFPSGEEFLSRDHPYVSDLDIFGHHSLFQLLDRTTTESGKTLLAKWLSDPVGNEEIIRRQEAVKELKPRLAWRQDFQATGMHYHNKRSDFEKILTWLDKPEKLFPSKWRFFFTGFVLAFLSTFSGFYFFSHIYSDTPVLYMIPLVVSITVNVLALRKILPVAEDISEDLFRNMMTLEAYGKLVEKIEKEKFDSGKLKEIRSVFSGSGYSASGEIRHLVNILDVFIQRGLKKEGFEGNPFYWLFNYLWLIDIYCILIIEKWKINNRNHLSLWAGAISEMEALCSLAGFGHANPGYSFPEIANLPFQIDCIELGHPLIGSTNRITNDFRLSGKGRIAMVTGSNMAGKSTFLRTVGINLILAYAGAPCCAESATISNLPVFTSMRTQDNLEAGVSSFYAELKRIEELLKMTDKGEPVFFLLDEMFKGTNSADRHKGGYSLIRQLGDMNAFGIIATHDLELARLAGREMKVINYNFASRIQGGRMNFNYRLNEGICTDFNASALMQQSGIKIISPDHP